MISEKVQEAINAQINVEMHSAYLYLSMSMDASCKGMKGVAHWFYKQFEEEQHHAMKFMKYLNDQMSKVILKPISSVPSSWDSAKEMFDAAYEHEKKLTAYIHHLCFAADEEKEYATLSFLQWFVDEQVEEESSVKEILDAIKCIGNDMAAFYLLDCRLAKR